MLNVLGYFDSLVASFTPRTDVSLTGQRSYTYLCHPVLGVMDYPSTRN